MEKPSILVIDDEVEVCTFFSFYFQEEKGFTIQVAYSGKDARACFLNNSYDLALVDLKLPDDDGINLLKEIKTSNPHCRVIIMTGYSTIKSAVEAMKYGADDYIDKPFDDLNQLDEILDQVLQEIQDDQSPFTPELDTDALNFGIVLAKNSPLKHVLGLGKKIANKKIPILIEGETGTGKELLARFIHGHSHRANHPFIPVNCGALSESLLESELFGHEKGAFTGASSTRRGFFEIAHNSTLFLDEINSASPAIQLKLLRVLETGEFFRVGGETHIKTDVRIIAASNQNLRQAVQEGDFREDLFYRLDVVKLHLPPLRERKVDLPLLIQYYLDKNKQEKGKGSLISFSSKAFDALMNYSWPGNVRELSNIIIRALTLCEEKEIPAHLLPKHILDTSTPTALAEEQVKDWETWRETQLHSILSQDSIQFMDVLEKWESEKKLFLHSLIMEILNKTENNQKRAAQLLGISPRILRYWKNEQK